MTFTQAEPNRRESALAAEPRWRMWGCLILLFIGLHIGIGPKIDLSQWAVSPGNNTALDEAMQWRKGSLALQHTTPNSEAPTVDGKKYNAVGYAFVLISVIGTIVSEWSGAEPGTFYGPFYVLIIYVPLVLVAFGAFRSLTGSSIWGAVLAAYLIAGTALRPTLAECRGGSIYHIDHVLGVMGLLLIGSDLLGSRRIWPALIGLALAVWSRQMTCFFAIPIFWLALRPGTSVDLPNTARRVGRSRGWLAIIGILMVAALPMTLSYVKFGNPIESGYAGMFADRTDYIARDAQTALWSPRWFKKHAVAMNLTLPDPDIRANQLFFDFGDRQGCSIWLASPLLLGIFLTARSWWTDRPRRLLMLTTILVLVGIYGYFTTSSMGTGYYRYSLDVVPIWLAVIAPFIISPAARPWTIACLGWSLLFQHILIP